MAENEKPKGKRAPKKTYKMPEKFSKGETLTDTTKVSWIIEKSIGLGGFGEIYSAAKASEPSKIKYAIKIEPVENGPLFCERNVYINIGKKEDIDEFIRIKKLKYLGIPTFYGFGSHNHYKKVDYRFIVIQKLGKDVWSYFKLEKTIPYTTILKIGIQILNVLEYMHRKGYVHCDVKGANLLLGEDKGTENHVYLVDFGLACKYSTTFSPNPKKAHNGTIEYLSRDAHQGVMTRRGDLEILAYNMLQWATSQLPWENLTAVTEVQTKKENFMKNPDKLLACCYKTEKSPAAIKDLFTLISKMEPLKEPEYKKFNEILTRELKLLSTDLEKLEFKTEKKEIAEPVKKKRNVPRPKLSPTKSFTELESDTGNGRGTEDTYRSGKRTLKRVLSNPDLKTKEEVPLRKSPRRKVVAATNGSNSTTVKKSWRDCPTIVNGVLPGVVEPPKKIGKR